MYFPYFFSNQYEMETIFKLKNEVKKDLIVPVISPYKRSKNITNLLSKIVLSEMKFIFVINPDQKRSNVKDQHDIEEYIHSFIKQKYTQVILGINIDSKNISAWKQFIDEQPDRKIAIFFKDIKGLDSDSVIDIAHKHNVIYMFFQGEATCKTFHTKFNNIIFKVILEDAFKKQASNIHYKNHEDEKFHDLHVKYNEFGFEGFGDFLTIGSQQTDANVASQPATIVIHYTYPDGVECETIRIKRFFGDLDKETEKLSDAILKSMKNAKHFIVNNTPLSCKLCNECNELIIKANKGKHYSNLGQLKKFSMLHHINMIIKLIH